MRFVHFTEPNGETVPIKPDDVVAIRPAHADQGYGNARALIVLESGVIQAVRESVAEAEEKLK